MTIKLNENFLTHSNTAKLLRQNMDADLQWIEHIKKKLKYLKFKLSKVFQLIGRKSSLSI